MSPVETSRIQILEALTRLAVPPVSDTDALGQFLAERGRLLAELDAIPAPPKDSAEWLSERENVLFLFNQGEELRRQAEYQRQRLAEELLRISQERQTPSGPR